MASGVSEEEDSAAPPRDPFLPPTDSFQFPQQSLDPLDLEDFPESEEDSLSLWQARRRALVASLAI